MQVDLISGAAILLIVFLFTLWAFQFQQRRGRFPSGPRPWLFLGNLLQKDIFPLYKTYSKLSKKYGPVFSIWLGTKPMIVICGYEAVKDALVTHSKEFGGRPPVPNLDQVTKGYGLISEHAKWKILRHFTLITLRNFGMGKRSMCERISEVAHCLVEKIATFEGQQFDIVLPIRAASSNVLCFVVFGNQLTYEGKTFSELLAILEAFSELFLTVPGLGTTVLPLGISVHFDPLFWEDPEQFDPAHFLDKKGKFQKKDACLPFSAGN
ncbi:cytochrome P450 2C23-like [Crotalus tigris]|uniref:cytochrome P450 2C23-like n=1 Tax=Crotalus tigris TaxID=88082 RepID=UPI00192F8D0F|nr:cytochrome P450 2C23-like [Crotalus tigris]